MKIFILEWSCVCFLACLNKGYKLGDLKTTEFYSLMVLGTRRCQQGHVALEVSREELFLPL